MKTQIVKKLLKSMAATPLFLVTEYVFASSYSDLKQEVCYHSISECYALATEKCEEQDQYIIPPHDHGSDGFWYLNYECKNKDGVSNERSDFRQVSCDDSLMLCYLRAEKTCIKEGGFYYVPVYVSGGNLASWYMDFRCIDLSDKWDYREKTPLLNDPKYNEAYHPE